MVCKGIYITQALWYLCYIAQFHQRVAFRQAEFIIVMHIYAEQIRKTRPNESGMKII